MPSVVSGAALANAKLPFLVGIPFTFSRSLTKTGTPASAPALELAAASCKAWSAQCCAMKLSVGFAASIFSNALVTT